MLSVLLNCPCTIFVAFALLLCYYVWTKLNYWKYIGIPYERASSVNRFITPFHTADLVTYKKYGKIVGLYAGLRPELLVGDADVVKLILGRDFHKFPNRRFVSGDHYFVGGKGLFILNFERWRRVRAITTPAFTSGKLKQMYPLVEDCVEHLLRNLNEATAMPSVDIKQLFSGFSLDVISSCCFGTKIDSQGNPDNPVVVNALKFFGFDFSFIRLLAFCFPFLITYKPIAWIADKWKLNAFDYDAQVFLGSLMRQILEERENNPNSKRSDFIQLLADAKLDESDPTTKQENDAGFLKQGYLRKLETQEIIDQAITFFIAGFDTTSNALTSTARFLALNPSVQEKLCTEIDETFSYGTVPVEYQTLHDMKYLDAVIKETLRLAPPPSRIERRCIADADLGVLRIPKGMIVNIPILAMHHDPDYFEEAEKYVPERFMPNTDLYMNPDAYIPFAEGPRNCIGRRFALLEMKLCLVKILQQCKFEESPETGKPLEYYRGQLVITPKKVMLKVTPRKIHDLH